MQKLLGMFIATCIGSLAVGAAPEWPVFDVPKLQGIVVDGDPSDWNGQGLRVPLHATREGYVPPSGDLRACVRLGWCDDGLLALFEVKDNVAFEHWNPGAIWRHDSIEFFLSAAPGEEIIYQLIASPGVMEGQPSPLQTDHLHGKGLRPVDAESKATVGRTKQPGGYTLETLLPLNNLELTPAGGLELALQAFVNDSDTADDRLRVQWHPGREPHGRGDPAALHRVRLSSNPGGNSTVSCYGKFLPNERMRVSVFGEEQDDDKTVVLMQAGKILYEGSLASYATQELFAEVVEFPLPARGNVVPPLEVTVDGATLALLALPKPAFQARTDMDKPFARDIANFEYRDKKAFPGPGGVVCIGSSSMKMWKTIHDDLAPLTVIHRGFGGSQIAHVLMYADRIVIPYKPKTVVVYAGENDLAAGASVQRVIDDTRAFFDTVHQALPKARIFYVSMKPSPSRMHLWPDFKKGNEAVRTLCESADYLAYINVADKMLDDKQKPHADIFLDDRLHMNAKGYQLWTSEIRPMIMESTVTE